MRRNFQLHPNENPSLAMVRIYKHIRTMQPTYEPQSNYTAKVKRRKAMKPKLRLVK